MTVTMSSSKPIVAKARVATAVPETSTEEKPATNFATPTPIGTKNSPPIVGLALFLECRSGPSFQIF